MVIQLQSVYQDGAEREDNLAQLVPVETPISIPQGADVTVEVTVVDQAGVPVDITGASFAFGLREFDFDAEPLISRAGVIQDADAGRVDVTLVPIDTKDIPIGPYRWSLWMVKSGRGHQLVPPSDCQLAAPGLTPAEVGSSDDAWVAPSGGGEATLPGQFTGEWGSDGSAGVEYVPPEYRYLDLDRLTAEDVIAHVVGSFKVDAGGTGTVRVRMGGTIGNADGTVIASGTVTGTSYAGVTLTGAAFENPGGLQLIQITLSDDTEGEETWMYGAQVEIAAA